MSLQKTVILLLLCLFSAGFTEAPPVDSNTPGLTFESVRKQIEKKEYVKALADFKTLPPDFQNPDHRFLNFFLNYITNNYAEVAVLSTEGLEDHILADYLFYYLAASLREKGEYAKAVETLDKNGKVFLGSRLFDTMISLRIRLAIDRAQFEEARKYLNRWGERKLSRDEEAEKLFLEGQVSEGLGKLDEAITAYKRVYVNYPVSSAAEEAKTRLQVLKSFEFVQIDLIARAETVLSDGYLYSAEQEFNFLSGIYARSNDRELLFYLAKLALKAGKKDAAKQNMELFAKYAEENREENPRLNGLLPEAKYEIAVREWNDGNEKKCAQISNWLIQNYPESEWTAKSISVLAKIAENKDDFPTAISFYEEYLKYSPEDDSAWWRLGWIHYLTGDYENAAGNFQQSRQQVKDASLEQQILFWLGMAQLKNGQTEEATDTFSTLLGKYKNTYYGYLAIAEAEQNGLTLVPKPVKTKPLNLSAETKLNQRQEEFLKRIEILNGFGLFHLATREIDHLNQTSENGDMDVLYLSRLYEKSKAYYQSQHVLLKALVKRGIYNYDVLPKTFLEELFPEHYIDLIQEAGKRHKVSPWFVLSLIKQESSFNPEIVSSAGAIGLMQLMPKTAEQTHRKEKLSPIIGENAFRSLEKPENNIEIGVAHIKGLAEQMDNSPMEVIASYNAGRNAVASWLKRFDRSNLPVFIERITYPETRNYVKKVITNIYNYEAVYGKQSQEEGVFGSPETIFSKQAEDTEPLDTNTESQQQ